VREDALDGHECAPLLALVQTLPEVGQGVVDVGDSGLAHHGEVIESNVDSVTVRFSDGIDGDYVPDMLTWREGDEVWTVGEWR
jgi:hypothetical protein